MSNENRTGELIFKPVEGHPDYSIEPSGVVVHVVPEHPGQTEMFLPVKYKEGELELFGPRKLASAVIHAGPPYPEPLLQEENLKPDMTVGEVRPLVCELENGDTFVAVVDKWNNDKNTPGRHNGRPALMTEVGRGRWDSPDSKPQIVGDNDKYTVKEYDEKILGRNLLNTARIIAKDDQQAQVAAKMTVVSGATELPKIENAKWVHVEYHLQLSEDGPGKTVLGLGIAKGLIKVDSKLMEKYGEMIPDYIEVLSKRYEAPTESEVQK